MAKRPYLDASIMRPIYNKYQQSGQTIKSFCTTEGINRHTFNYWRLKFIQADQLPPATFSQVPIPVKHIATSSIVLRVGHQLEMELPVDYPVASLSQLLTQLSC